MKKQLLETKIIVHETTIAYTEGGFVIVQDSPRGKQTVIMGAAESQALFNMMSKTYLSITKNVYRYRTA